MIVLYRRYYIIVMTRLSRTSFPITNPTAPSRPLISINEVHCVEKMTIMPQRCYLSRSVSPPRCLGGRECRLLLLLLLLLVAPKHPNIRLLSFEMAMSFGKNVKVVDFFTNFEDVASIPTTSLLLELEASGSCWIVHNRWYETCLCS